jgi:hypothetical protein
MISRAEVFRRQLSDLVEVRQREVAPNPRLSPTDFSDSITPRLL